MNLDRSLESIEASVYTMGELVIKQHEKVLEMLHNKDKEIALSIVKKDEYVNRYEEDINNQAIAQFALLSPVATDLRRVIAAIKIASELERIGDYAKGFAAYVIRGKDLEEDEIINHSMSMETSVIEMLKEAMEAYKDGNLDLAFLVPEKNVAIEELAKEFKNTLIDTPTIDKKQVVYLAGLLRNINRTKDHTVNICEHIVYLKKGIYYDFN